VVMLTLGDRALKTFVEETRTQVERKDTAISKTAAAHLALS
jgi:hypothetical protein